MTGSIYRDLAWLPRKPAQFGRLCREALEASAGVGDRIRSLALHALDIIALDQLATTIKRAKDRGDCLEPLIPFTIEVMSNATTRLLSGPLIATAARHGIALTCVETDSGKLPEDVFSDETERNCSLPDAVLIAVDHHGLPMRACPGDHEARRSTVAACLAQIDSLRDRCHRNRHGVCILQTVAQPSETLFGSLECTLTGTAVDLVDGINRGIRERVAASSDVLLDVAGLAATVGLAEWHDPTLWNVAKLPFRADLVPLYAEYVCRIIAAVRGKSRRCLVLDLDNTVWGGVVGDDGIEGITLGQGDAAGESYLSVQRIALDLRERGVVLAVCSKNFEDVARKAFREHPEMLLKPEHIAAFRANWEDKALNIQAISAELALGYESRGFLEDDPAPRDRVSRSLPPVAGPEQTEDTAQYARTLAAAGYFESVTFSPEDRMRAEYYQANKERVALARQSSDVESYLPSLEMTVTFQPFDRVGRSRVAQLIGKANQFNLTNRRYTEAELGVIQDDPDYVTLQVRLNDRLGDSGMISAIVCRQNGADGLIDTWVMSCRALGRKVECAVLQELVFQCRQKKITRILGTYKPTDRNRLVNRHYELLGFSLIESRADGSTVWGLDLSEVRHVDLPIQVRRLKV